MDALLDLLETNREASHLYEAFRAYGYLVTAEPIPGQEDRFIECLREGYAKLDEIVRFNAKTYRYRGFSKAARAALHRDLPQPCWLVELIS